MVQNLRNYNKEFPSHSKNQVLLLLKGEEYCENDFLPTVKKNSYLMWPFLLKVPMG